MYVKCDKGINIDQGIDISIYYRILTQYKCDKESIFFIIYIDFRYPNWRKIMKSLSDKEKDTY